LTPHPGEAARLLSVDTNAVQRDRLAAVNTLARRTGAVVVLKGHRTLVGAPDGRLFVNATGNPGMATGGSGDILTGVVAGLLAQFPREDRLNVAAAAVYLHGLAGDLAAAELGEMALSATDITKHLHRAFAIVRDTTEEARVVLARGKR
jgi:NAD(P)H-hydrate epimerase